VEQADNSHLKKSDMQLIINADSATGGDTGSLTTDTDTAEGLQHYYRGLVPVAVAPLVCK